MMALGSKGANHCWNMQAFCSYTTKTYFYSAARCAQSNLAGVHKAANAVQIGIAQGARRLLTTFAIKIQ